MMNESFDLPVVFNDRDLSLPAQFLRTGYSYKIQVDVFGSIIDFEPDEERNWRAIIREGQQSLPRDISPALLQAIAHSLEEITKA